MNLEQTLLSHIKNIVQSVYSVDVPLEQLSLQKTRANFEGDVTLVVFPLTKQIKANPAEIADSIGKKLCDEATVVEKYNVVQGFLNLTIKTHFWVEKLQEIYNDETFGFKKMAADAPVMMIEYSCPNTNKPLHLGHIRNNLLGWSLVKIQQANGWKVVKTNIVNDRGIHICKSMLAWQKFGNGETPQSSGKKGDHLVGDYYVRFDKEYKKQINQLIADGMDEETAKKEAPLMKEAHEMLVKWEQGDAEVIQLWKMMNGWVYEGFDATYKQLGVSFDKVYYESDTYLVGREEVLRGLQEGIFYKREDNSIWADLSKDGLDEKLLLRSDGTSVYITQDLGTAKLRSKDYNITKMVHVVGNEQEYHFKVLAILLDKLGCPFGKSLMHFSHGMVELPNGKMKSREGTVVDADDLMAQMIDDAKKISADKVNTLPDITPEEADEIARIVGLGALKYFILKVDARKNVLFDPQESIDFNGNTGPFIQYTYARIQSILRKYDQLPDKTVDFASSSTYDPNEKELDLIRLLCDYPAVVEQAGTNFSPSTIANYVYSVACTFNSFYHDYSILNEKEVQIRDFRVLLSTCTARIIASAMDLLGIEVPQRM
ncbi:MAG: arginine--tRNA ligase [Paludibacteraceae bacterium]|nr:arginine--tRNA ligase [Paludibacteraceae bacterium]